MHTALLTRINRFAPIAAGLLLLAIISLGGIDAHRHSGLQEYMDNVRAAIEAIPHNLHGAVGSDVEPTAAAVRILSPNKILQRRYLDPVTGSSMSLLLVHCGDVRDMQGHYPPICYPAHGWQLAGRRSVPIEIAGTQSVAVVYEFVRTDDLVERRMTVLNFFVLPGGTAQFASDMDAVERVARSRAATGLGVAQVQIVLDGTPGNEEQLRVAEQVLPALEPLVRAIGRGVER